MKSVAFGLFATALVFSTVGCHHHRCHGGGIWQETKVKYKYKEERSSCSAPPCVLPCPAPVVPNCLPVAPVIDCPPPVFQCPGPITIMVQEEVCQPVTVCVPVYAWVWKHCQCRYVYLQVGARSECRMDRRLVTRQVTAYWSVGRGCYGWTDGRGNWRPHHGR
jgi:hypothetical protein